MLDTNGEDQKVLGHGKADTRRKRGFARWDSIVAQVSCCKLNRLVSEDSWSLGFQNKRVVVFEAGWGLGTHSRIRVEIPGALLS
jgi:hypothetical protein